MLFQAISLLHISTVQSYDVFVLKSARVSVSLLPRKNARVSLQRLLGNQFAQEKETIKRQSKEMIKRSSKVSEFRKSPKHHDIMMLVTMTSPILTHTHTLLTPGGERGLWQLPPAARLEMLRRS